MDWSLALVRRPSSKRIAARTESPSWTRAARREGCGWGKWVISWLHYATLAGSVTGYGSRWPDSSAGRGFQTAKTYRAQSVRHVLTIEIMSSRTEVKLFYTSRGMAVFQSLCNIYLEYLSYPRWPNADPL